MISGGYEIAFLFWTGEVVVFGNDCDWATIRYNVSDIITYQQEYKIGVDLKDEAMKIYIDGHHHHLVQHVRRELPRWLDRLQDLLLRPRGPQPHGRELVDADPRRPWSRRLVRTGGPTKPLLFCVRVVESSQYPTQY